MNNYIVHNNIKPERLSLYQKQRQNEELYGKFMKNSYRTSGREGNHSRKS